MTVSRVAIAIDECLLLFVNNNKFFYKNGNTHQIQAADFSKRFSLGRGLHNLTFICHLNHKSSIKELEGVGGVFISVTFVLILMK